MERSISIAQYIQAIQSLPADPPVDNPRKWYKTEKEHWLGWLADYENPGAYGRKTGVKRDAKFAYNHVVEPAMLLYLIRTIPLSAELMSGAEQAYQNGFSLMEKSAAIRKAVPWLVIYQALWGKQKPPLGKRVAKWFLPKSKAQQRGAEDPAPVKDTVTTVSTEPAQVQNLALSVRQPYAEQIMRGTKKIEYRSKLTHIRGRVYLYASLAPAEHAFSKMGATPGDFPTGVIVGTVEIVGCTDNGDSFEWHLARPQRLTHPIKPERHPQPAWFKPFEEHV